jgi:hypothetical protein
MITVKSSFVDLNHEDLKDKAIFLLLIFFIELELGVDRVSRASLEVFGTFLMQIMHFLISILFNS